MTSFSGCLSKFQSTLSVRRATHVVDLGPVGVDISIHALRKESDTSENPYLEATKYFNPRSP